MPLSKPAIGIRQFLYRWHRRIGVATAIFVCILSITGILLNHTEALQLDSRYANSSLLRKVYGLPATLDIQVINIAGQNISQFDESIYLGTKAVDTCPGDLVGAVALNGDAFNSILVACTHGLLWLNLHGDFLDFISIDQLNSSSISALGLSSQNKPVIDNSSAQLIVNLDTLNTEVSATDIQWSNFEAASPETAKLLTHHFYQKTISWERLILDTHSGRIFGGNFGVFLMDISAIILLLLSISGVYMWWIRRA